MDNKPPENLLNQSSLLEDKTKLSIETVKQPSNTEPEAKSTGKTPAKSITIEDFTILASLGQGSYGEVVWAQKNNNKKQYAIKIIDKLFMKRENKEYQAFAEKNFLAKLNHPGVVKLHCTFQDKLKLYFVLDFLSGGPFSEFLKTHDGPLSDEAAKFCAAEIVSTLEYIHKNGVVHRDIKPENLMLTKDGHLKLIDFGTAKKMNAVSNEKGPMDRRSTFVGTAFYVAPELIEESECSAPADLWALGCIIFLMTTGKMPFVEQNEYLIFQQIKQVKIQWPSEMNSVTRDLIESLLRRNPCERLGAGPEGSKNDYNALKGHPFFKGVSFDTIFDEESPILSLMTPRKQIFRTDDPTADMFLLQPKKSENLPSKQDSSTSILDFLSREALAKEHKILLAGEVDKKSPYMLYQLRQLVLTDEPRLKYIDPLTNEYKKEIPLNKSTIAELENKFKFHVIIPTRRYTFKSRDHPAEKWVNAINEICKSLA